MNLEAPVPPDHPFANRKTSLTSLTSRRTHFCLNSDQKKVSTVKAPCSNLPRALPPLRNKRLLLEVETPWHWRKGAANGKTRRKFQCYIIFPGSPLWTCKFESNSSMYKRPPYTLFLGSTPPDFCFYDVCTAWMWSRLASISSSTAAE